jgi:pilus assembly protein CpaB
MNWKTWVPLILAIVLGVAAAKVARDQIMKTRLAAGPAGQFVKVVVAKSDIIPGKELKPEDLNLAQVQENAAPATAFKTVEDLLGPPARVTEMTITKGQPIVEAMLTQTGSGSGLQALVPPGMRAITMEVNEFSGLAGLIAPGVRVDVIATLSEGGNGSQLAKTIVQNVQVKAVGQRTTVNSSEPPNPSEMFRSVTLLAKPDEAESIELACATGRPRLVLRGGRDNEVVASAGITLSKLRGNKEQEDPFTAPPVTIFPPTTTQPVADATTQPATPGIDPLAHRMPPRRMVKVIRGGQETTVTLNVLDGNPDNTVTDTNDPQDVPNDNSKGKDTDPFESGNE